MTQLDPEQDRTVGVTILTPGATLAQYKIVRQLGVGGMGEVFLAEDSKLGRKVALKFLGAQFATDQNVRERFMREARAAAALNHPNIITIYEVAQHQERVFIAMEYVEGESLREVIDNGGLTLERTLKIALQMCDGLAAAHDAGFVHRDIKPHNIIVDPKERLRILDFGLAKATGDSQLTQVGQALGTVHYMSPEQGQGLEADRRSDIFSVGIVLYEMITGRLPFKKPNIPATLHAIMHDQPEPLNTIVEDIPSTVKAAIERALTKEVDQRYQDISELARDLHGQTTGMAAGITAPPPPPPSPPDAAATVEAVPKTRSVAVLHLRNLGAEEDDFLCYGITEDLIIDLTRVGSIRVAPMRSVMKYKDSDTELQEIGQQLGVDLILDGSIMKTPQGLRVSAQLVEISTGSILWAERWEEPPDRLPQVKSSLAEGVSQFLNLGTTVVRKAEVGMPESENAEAYEQYLKAKYLFDRKQSVSEVDIALGMYRQALHTEPDFLAARAGVVEILLYQGMFEQAQTEVESALKEAEENQRLPEQANLLLLDARLKAKQAGWGEATALANRALDLSRNLGDLDGEAEALALLISVLQPQSRFDDALLLFDRVLEISRQLEDQEKIAEAMKNMGVAYSRKGDYDRAMELYDEALEIAENSENLSLQAACYSNIGNLHMFRGDLERAYDFYSQALEIDSRLGDRAGSARHNLNMGLVQLQRGKQREGLKLLQKSSELFEALSDRINLAMTLSNISQVRLQLGESDGAMSAAERALTISQETGHPLSASIAHHRLAATFLFERDFEAASNHMHIALEIAKENNLSRNLAGLESDLARLHYLRGEYVEADKHAQRARTAAREIGDKVTQCKSGAYLAALSSRSGLFTSGRRQLERYLKEANGIEDADLIHHVEMLLSAALFAHGNKDDQADGRLGLIDVIETLRKLQNEPLARQAEEILNGSRQASS